MSDIAVKAVENHRKGYNCAQAVACAFADRLGIDEKEIFKTMEAYGFGMGTMGNVRSCVGDGGSDRYE